MIPTITATNAFYYYADLDRAWAFYREILGLETVADYGSAKIMKLAQSSFLTLVDVESGMHTLDEPKSVTTAFVTDQVAEWNAYLKAAGVPFHREFTVKEDSAHDGFVVLDPEGYFLEFEVFKPHSENVKLLPALNNIEHTYTDIGQRPKNLGIQATVQWLYYDDLPSIEQFYESLLGVTIIADQGWAKLYLISGSGIIGLVDGKEGLHKVSEQKCVTLSFFTDDIESWFERATNMPQLKLRSKEINLVHDHVRTFVAYDPSGYFLEWDQFLK